LQKTAAWISLGVIILFAVGWFAHRSPEINPPSDNFPKAESPSNDAIVDDWNRASAEPDDAKTDFNSDIAAANETLSRLHAAAEQGDVKAQFDLGAMHHHGKGTPKDYAEAVRWYHAAAEQGHTKAQFNLGVLHDNGEGTPVNHSEAVRWYRAAAEQNNANAQFNLGVMHDTGMGTPKNDVEAVRWYRAAAEQGNAKAQFNLGVMSAKGTGTQRNSAKAARWLRAAAVQGHSKAQLYLGIIYDGKRTRQSDIDAYLWISLAKAGGEQEAAKALDTLTQRMVEQQITEAQTRAEILRQSLPQG